MRASSRRSRRRWHRYSRRSRRCGNCSAYPPAITRLLLFSLARSQSSRLFSSRCLQRSSVSTRAFSATCLENRFLIEIYREKKEKRNRRRKRRVRSRRFSHIRTVNYEQPRARGKNEKVQLKRKNSPLVSLLVDLRVERFDSSRQILNGSARLGFLAGHLLFELQHPERKATLRKYRREMISPIRLRAISSISECQRGKSRRA